VARFDVHEAPFETGLLLDCQADLLSHFNTRLVIPLMTPDHAPMPAGRLNPLFEIDGKPYRMVTQFAAAIEVRALGPVVASLGDNDREIMNALDLLISGV